MSEKKQVQAEKPADADATGPVKVALRKAITAHGEEVMSIEFREPTGADIENYGNPVNIDFASSPPKISFDERKMAQMMAGLAGVPPSSIRQMHPKDWNTAAWSVAGFFVPDMAML